jgi:hypothetical protein
LTALCVAFFSFFVLLFLSVSMICVVADECALLAVFFVSVPLQLRLCCPVQHQIPCGCLCTRRSAPVCGIELCHGKVLTLCRLWFTCLVRSTMRPEKTDRRIPVHPMCTAGTKPQYGSVRLRRARTSSTTCRRQSGTFLVGIHFGAFPPAGHSTKRDSIVCFG